MKELYFTPLYRRSLRAVKLEFGQGKKKFLFRNFEGGMNRKGESETALKNISYPTKSGSEHVQESLFKMADEKDY